MWVVEKTAESLENRLLKALDAIQTAAFSDDEDMPGYHHLDVDPKIMKQYQELLAKKASNQP